MICPECAKEGKKSTVYEGISMSTAMFCQAYYDEEGRRHDHDSNRRTTEMHCSNGHHFVQLHENRCWCGWKSS